MNRFVIDVAANGWMKVQGAELGSEDQLVIDLGIQQRFLADSIAGEKERAIAGVPNCEGKHAAQMFRTIRAVQVIRVDDRFGVAVCLEAMSGILELLAEFAVVINLSVEDDPGGAIRVGDRLLAALQINDCETAHRQAHAVIEVKSIFIGPAMMNCFVHAREQLAVDRRAITTNNSCYATHLIS